MDGGGNGPAGPWSRWGGDGGGEGGDSGPPTLLLGAAAVTPSKTSSEKEGIDWRRFWDFITCLALPALGISQFQHGDVDKHVWLALTLMAVAPTLWVLRYFGLATVYFGPWGEWAIANSYIAAEMLALARVFLGLSL